MRTRTRLGAAVPWFASAGVHALLITLGFFIVWSALPTQRAEPTAIVTTFDSPSGAPFRAEATASTPPMGASIGVSAPTPANAIVSSVPSLAEVVASPAPVGSALVLPSVGMEPPPLTNVAPPAEVRFFGVEATQVRDVVYVVDASGSMVTTFPFVLDELERSSRALDALQRFQVIFFKGESGKASGRLAAPHPTEPDRVLETRLIRATPDNVRSVMTWARTVKPGGRSNPLEALRVAINLKPDAIMMLSSSIGGTGQWEAPAEQILGELDALNPVDRRTGRRPIAIMTVQMIEEDPSGLLRAIGEQHAPGGEGYRYISRSELNR